MSKTDETKKKAIIGGLGALAVTGLLYWYLYKSDENNNKRQENSIETEVFGETTGSYNNGSQNQHKNENGQQQQQQQHEDENENEDENGNENEQHQPQQQQQHQQQQHQQQPHQPQKQHQPQQQQHQPQHQPQQQQHQPQQQQQQHQSQQQQQQQEEQKQPELAKSKSEEDIALEKKIEKWDNLLKDMPKLNSWKYKDGHVRITAVRANNLETKDDDSESDPFVEMVIGSKKQSTKHINDNNNPVWNETLVFDVKDVTKEKLVATVFDFDKFTKNDKIGVLNYRLIDLCKNNGHVEGKFPLEGSKGNITLSIKYYEGIGEGKKK